MDKNSRASCWEKVQRGVKETERLMGQKQYNLSMMKARQTLEYMVRCLGDQAGIMDGDLNSTIDELALNKWISKTTSEHYHTIRILGNRALHEGNDNAYDCNQAYHLLSQEVYTFANDYNARRKSSSVTTKNRTKSRRKQKRMPILPVITILCLVIVIIIVVKVFSPKRPDETDTPGVSTSSDASVPPTETPPATTPPETMAPTTPAPVYKAADHLNVRQEPSTDSRRLGLIEPGTTVNVIERHDDNWMKILYDGTEAYVASEYLVQD